MEKQKLVKAGAMWFSVGKNASPEVQMKLPQIMGWLAQNKVSLSISLGDQKNPGPRLVGYVNGFKDGPNKPDFNLYEAPVRPAGRFNSAPRSQSTYVKTNYDLPL